MTGRCGYSMLMWHRGASSRGSEPGTAGPPLLFFQQNFLMLLFSFSVYSFMLLGGNLRLKEDVCMPVSNL